MRIFAPNLANKKSCTTFSYFSEHTMETSSENCKKKNQFGASSLLPIDSEIMQSNVNSLENEDNQMVTKSFKEASFADPPKRTDNNEVLLGVYVNG